MLLVPHMLRNMIDAITNGVSDKQGAERLPTIPVQYMTEVLLQILEFLKLPADSTFDQLLSYPSAEESGAMEAISGNGHKPMAGCLPAAG